MLDDPADWVRALNLVLCVVSLAGMATPRAFRWWLLQRYEVRLYLLALAGSLVATASGTAQALTADSPGGVHVMAYTAALLLAATATITLQIRLRRDTHE